MSRKAQDILVGIATIIVLCLIAYGGFSFIIELNADTDCGQPHMPACH